jgi:hypothetical protein
MTMPSNSIHRAETEIRDVIERWARAESLRSTRAFSLNLVVKSDAWCPMRITRSDPLEVVHVKHDEWLD